LALQVAADLLSDFADGVWFIDLAPITDAGLVMSTIASTLGVKETGGQPLVDSLKAFLREKQILLVLDNFEQVVAAAPLVADLLKAASRLKMLVTSRAVLHLSGEHEFAVPALAVPDPKHLPELAALVQYAAVALFIQRAQAVKPDFQVTSANAPAVAEICVRLDGLPLAIQLAAARIKLLPPTALLGRLSNRLKVLTGGIRDLPARQQTMRATIEWSYHLLQPAEQRLFWRLAVFVGGWTVAAAEAVCNADGDPPLDGLQSLLDKSLIQQVEGADGEIRFTMLETVREYAIEQLAGGGEEEAARRQHAAYYLALVEAAATELHGTQQAQWLDRLEAEHDNLRTALVWSMESRAIEVGLRIAAALISFWSMRGYVREGRRHLNAVLACTAAPAGTTPRPFVPDPHVARALAGAGELAWLQGDYALARDELEQSVGLWRQLAGRHGLAEALHMLGHVRSDQRDYAAAQALFEESLALYEAAGDTRGGLPLLGDLGLIAYHHGDYTLARARFEQSLPLYRAQGLQDNVGVTLNRLGDLARLAGDYERAAALYEESLSVFEALRSGPYIASARHKLAYVWQQRGDYRQTHAFLVESLRLQHQVGNKQGIAECLAGLAGWATAVQQLERAARLFSATAALLTAAGVPLAPADQAEYARDLATARAQLDEAVWAVAWTEGQAMPLEQAIAYALEEVPEA
jgi:predicted ATPase